MVVEKLFLMGEEVSLKLSLCQLLNFLFCFMKRARSIFIYVLKDFLL